MVDILHKVGIEAPAAEVYSALTTVEGLAGWWTGDTRGDGASLGGLLEFRFPAGGFDMRVRDLGQDERVVWEVVDGPEEWVGTRVDWTVRGAGDRAVVLFKHEGWKEPVEFMHHCSTKWATYLMSLKSLVETGKGAPSPDDVKIDDWD
ncbi:SRPBCC domain-containing protein [Actinokineospora soli]|uniref:SRPBCC domain-containing protein n=1 Tax=Actinokineospora soli TaxID=1048753 RepID=A0ABW2TU86_9PSEU